MTGDPRGVLYPARLPTFHRLPAPAQVSALVRWFWVPEWNLAAGRVSRQRIIAFPASNLVVEHTMVGVSGPTTRASNRDLTGSGWAVGALLWPAAVPTFLADPAELRNGYRSLDLPDLHARVAAHMNGDAAPDVRRARAVDALAGWLTERVPVPGDEQLLANRMAHLIDSDPDIVRVEDAASHLAVSVRTLQRLARRYVGLPPAAMIRRRRLQEAAERLRADPTIDIADIAAELGYADHAHLASEFRTVLGFTPSGYRRQVGHDLTDSSD